MSCTLRTLAPHPPAHQAPHSIAAPAAAAQSLHATSDKGSPAHPSAARPAPSSTAAQQQHTSSTAAHMSAGVMFQLAVAGAHLSGLPLNHQLTSLGATLVRTVRTAPVYKMYSLGPKPALIRQPPGSGGAAIELEVWEMPIDKVGFFLRDGVKAPLGIGDVLLEDESIIKGFIGEAYAVEGAPDISKHGGWRAFLAAQQTGGSS